MNSVVSGNRFIAELLDSADIRVDGDRPWDIRLYSERLFDRVLARGSLGLGEAYIDGEWDSEQLDAFFCRALSADLDEKLKPWRLLGHKLRSRLLNRQSRRRAWQVGQRHYDLGNDFYRAMLDPRMTYSCGYWPGADNLAAAQEAKLDLICRKLHLEPGMRVLDIGCGWGSFMGYAAQKYSVQCTGVTVSREQVALARERYAHLPLEFLLLDYRNLEGDYDRVVSVGMFEHVGHRNHRTFMAVARRCLRDDGLALLHTIGKNRVVGAGATDPWIDRYIFTNGEIPALGQVTDSLEGLFTVEDLHNFGADYDPTLMAWYSNFEAAWPRFRDTLDERFRRMWRYYLLSCAGAFRARKLQLWQWVLSPQGVAGGYRRAS
ncbi:cyclopropane fatty acyl phospholipid synthase [Parahaliea mediterranea]|uniref:cyclopropane fatty acyl phospholipid synthase n=1 Tax=Parahaliea mediterranea TaxID=651086 RepID=UPI00321BE5D5